MTIDENLSIQLLHKGEDYAIIKVNGKEKEITIREYDLIKQLIKTYSK